MRRRDPILRSVMTSVSTTSFTRRGVLVASAGALLFGAGRAQAEPRDLTVYKTPWCGCCKGWVAHMVRAGFRPKVVEQQDLEPVRRRHGIPFRLSSCHTAVVGGHIPGGFGIGGLSTRVDGRLER